MIQNQKRWGLTLILTSDTKLMVWLLNPYGLKFYSLIPSDLMLEWN